MGAWGTGIFSNDIALDVRGDFRELIAAGRSPQEATEQILVLYEMAEQGDAYYGEAWLALAVTQWKMGRVVDEVRDTALRAIELELAQPIFEGTDVRKRAAALSKARDLLNSTPPEPRRVRAERVSQSPFASGDVLRYTTASGRQVALWAMYNERHEGVASVSVNTCFRVQAIGDPELPPLAEIVERPPLVMSTDGGPRSVRHLFLHEPQDAGGPAWKVIGNVPFPDEHADKHGFTVLTVKPRRRPPTMDDVFESWFALSRGAEPETRALQLLIDLMPAHSTLGPEWEGFVTARAADIARELAVELHEGSDARLGPALAIVERYLAGDDPAQRRVAIDVLDVLLNASTHPEVAFDRDDLEHRLGAVSQAMAARLDDAWAEVEVSAWRPPELLSEAEHHALQAVWYPPIQWDARLNNRDLGDGTYRICFSLPGLYRGLDAPDPSVNRQAPATTID
jgi:hypothetical protein